MASVDLSAAQECYGATKWSAVYCSLLPASLVKKRFATSHLHWGCGAANDQDLQPPHNIAHSLEKWSYVSRIAPHLLALWCKESAIETFGSYVVPALSTPISSLQDLGSPQYP